MPHWYSVENALLSGVPRYETLADVARALAYNPLADLDLGSVDDMQRISLLTGEKDPLFPTETSVFTAAKIISMHRHSLALRNPALAWNRMQTDDQIKRGMKGFDYGAAQAFPGSSCLAVRGISGLAKSVTVKRTLVLLGPQVIRHGKNDAAGWLQASQLNYLYAPMSHDGSRGGLLTAIRTSFDKAFGLRLGTTVPPANCRSIESQVAWIIALLHSVYTGIIVIDEIQKLNLDESKYAEEMHLMILSLMNCGIPVVLVGNPLGFVRILRFSSIASRLAVIEPVDFHPAGALTETFEGTDPDWADIDVGVRTYYVLREPVREPLICSVALKRFSGGNPREALSLWCGSQCSAIQVGREWIGLADLERTYENIGIQKIKNLCEGFRYRNPYLFQEDWSDDIPIDEYARRWGVSYEPTLNGTAEARPQRNAAKRDSPQNESAKQRAAFKSAQTRDATKAAKRAHLKETLSPADMRQEGIKMHALESLRQMEIGLSTPDQPEKNGSP